MIEHRSFQLLGATRSDWRDTRMHFRVGACGRPDHGSLGALYAWDDEAIAPHAAFGLDAHRNVEIVTWVRSGAIMFEDDAGNRTRLVADSMQVMHAGAAIHLAERNEENVAARLFRIWLHPRTPGGTPRSATRTCSRECREGRFVTLASGDPDDVCAGALPIHADARVRIATLQPGHDGASRVAGVRRGVSGCRSWPARCRRSPARAARRVAVRDEARLTLVARDDTDVVMVELLR